MKISNSLTWWLAVLAAPLSGCGADGSAARDEDVGVEGVAEALVATDYDQPMFLKVGGSGKCLDADPAALGANGGAVRLWDCNGGTNQQWLPKSDGTWRNAANGRCLDAYLPSAGSNGGTVFLYDCKNDPANDMNQRWTQNGLSLRLVLNGKCLDAHGPDVNTNGGRIQVWDCGSQSNQQWTMQPATVATVRVLEHCDSSSSQIQAPIQGTGCFAVTGNGPSYLDLPGGVSVKLFPTSDCSGDVQAVVGDDANLCSVAFSDGSGTNDRVRSIYVAPKSGCDSSTGSCASTQSPSSTVMRVFYDHAPKSTDPSYLAVRGSDNCLYYNALADTSVGDLWAGWKKIEQAGCWVASAPSIAATWSGSYYPTPVGHVAYRQSDSWIYDTYSEDGGKTWSTPQRFENLGSQDGPALVHVPNGSLNGQDGDLGYLALFIRGTDNVLYVKTLATSTGAKWSAWGQIGAASDMGSAPSVTEWSSEGYHFLELVYRRGSDGHIMHGWTQVLDASNRITNDAGTGWEVEDLGGVTYSAPSGAAFTDRSYTVFARGTDEALWMRTYTPRLNGYTPWQKVQCNGISDIGGVTSGVTTLVRPSRAGAQMHVFWRNPGKDVGHAWYETGSNVWGCNSVGGGITDGPSAAFSRAPYQPN